jgi:hypothetical protein
MMTGLLAVNAPSSSVHNAVNGLASGGNQMPHIVGYRVVGVPNGDGPDGAELWGNIEGVPVVLDAVCGYAEEARSEFSSMSREANPVSMSSTAPATMPRSGLGVLCRVLHSGPSRRSCSNAAR